MRNWSIPVRPPAAFVRDLPGAGEVVSLFTLLDRSAWFTHRWDRRERLIRLRSRTWFLDRPREIPLRYVRRWKELIAERGALPLDAYLEAVTTLTDTQIESLDRLVVSAVLPTDLFGAELCRDMLRLYASLLPSQRETLQHGGIIPVSRMTPRQQEQFVATLKRPMGVPPEELTPEQYDILRRQGTEPPFTGSYVYSKEKGVYRCAACAAELARPRAFPCSVRR